MLYFIKTDLLLHQWLSGVLHDSEIRAIDERDDALQKGLFFIVMCMCICVFGVG